MKRATFLQFAVGAACATALPLLHAQPYPSGCWSRACAAPARTRPGSR